MGWNGFEPIYILTGRIEYVRILSIKNRLLADAQRYLRKIAKKESQGADSVIEDMGHDIWKYAYHRELPEWLFSENGWKQDGLKF